MSVSRLATPGGISTNLGENTPVDDKTILKVSDFVEDLPLGKKEGDAPPLAAERVKKGESFNQCSVAKLGDLLIHAIKNRSLDDLQEIIQCPNFAKISGERLGQAFLAAVDLGALVLAFMACGRLAAVDNIYISGVFNSAAKQKDPTCLSALISCDEVLAKASPDALANAAIEVTRRDDSESLEILMKCPKIVDSTDILLGMLLLEAAKQPNLRCLKVLTEECKWLVEKIPMVWVVEALTAAGRVMAGSQPIIDPTGYKTLLNWIERRGAIDRKNYVSPYFK